MIDKTEFEKQVRAKVKAINAKISALSQETDNQIKSTLDLLDKIDNIKAEIDKTSKQKI
jgi:uncharacterized protein YaaR (DUF327 family)